MSAAKAFRMPTGRKLMGEVAEARFKALCSALGVEGVMGG
jgi:hypothetical protein